MIYNVSIIQLVSSSPAIVKTLESSVCSNFSVLDLADYVTIKLLHRLLASILIAYRRAALHKHNLSMDQSQLFGT
jgi:hypothetical protein